MTKEELLDSIGRCSVRIGAPCDSAIKLVGLFAWLPEHMQLEALEHLDNIFRELEGKK